MVEYLRSKKGKKESYFVFPDVPDTAEVNQTEIILKAHVRDLRRGRFVCSDAEGLNLE